MTAQTPTPHPGSTILVSGAGVAGLCTAYWLARYGHRVTVVEHAPALRPGGQALDVRGPALEVARRMGLLSPLQARATRLAGMSIVDGQGRELSRSTERTLTGGRLDSPDIEVLRDDLCAVLHGAVADACRAGDGQVEFLFGDRAMAIAQDGEGVDVVFEHAAPRRFDLVVGADGLHSGVRGLVFGPEVQFLRFTGLHIAVFSVPNFLGLDHWQVFCQDEHSAGGLVMAGDPEGRARVYLGFGSQEPLDTDPRDTVAHKRLIAAHYAKAGWEFPKILAHMQEAPDFYFYSASQVRMGRWSKGRVVLVGDAGYSVTPATGQGTTVAMVGACVLAGELAAHGRDMVAGVASYENELRDYVARNLDAALDMADSMAESVDPQGAHHHADGTPDFGTLVQPFALKPYTESMA